MKTITVDLNDAGYSISVDVEEVSMLEQTWLVAQAPDDLIEASKLNESEFDEANLSKDVIDYLIEVTTSLTEYTESDLEKLSIEDAMKVSAEVVNAVFTDAGTDKTRRIKRVTMTEEAVELLFRGKVTMAAGLPDDASLENFNYDVSRNSLQFIFSSSKWEKIAEGAEIPFAEAKIIDVGDSLDARI